MTCERCSRETMPDDMVGNICCSCDDEIVADSDQHRAERAADMEAEYWASGGGGWGEP